ncbi:hypothetical protein AMTR_s00111p00106630 [Amborella trichopoda]|uniref:Uncharacterized protein n=1 Tax=Amborella trichopoda TaxID=13333 RepID=W1NY01_AMBTC|nr:hypothetical protein AMTR_s00111p00106630 [Amborella trichopoda]
MGDSGWTQTSLALSTLALHSWRTRDDRKSYPDQQLGGNHQALLGSPEPSLALKGPKRPGQEKNNKKKRLRTRRDEPARPCHIASPDLTRTCPRAMVAWPWLDPKAIFCDPSPSLLRSSKVELHQCAHSNLNRQCTIRIQYSQSRLPF